MLDEMKRDLMDAYDENGDGKIEIREVFYLRQRSIDRSDYVSTYCCNHLHSHWWHSYIHTT